jgi:hypothetical protein
MPALQLRYIIIIYHDPPTSSQPGVVYALPLEKQIYIWRPLHYLPGDLIYYYSYIVDRRYAERVL